MASPIVAIGKERDKEYMRKEDENCNTMKTSLSTLLLMLFPLMFSPSSTPMGLEHLLKILSPALSIVIVFLSFLSSPYGLIISPSMYGYNVTQSPMWLILTCLISDLLWLRHYSTSRQLSLGAVPCVPTHPFMDALALVLLTQHDLCTDLYSI